MRLAMTFLVLVAAPFMLLWTLVRLTAAFVLLLLISLIGIWTDVR